MVRVNDLKLSVSGSQLRLLGAEVGVRGILRGLASWLERAVVAVAKVFGKKIDEQIIAWNYMDLLDRDLSEVQLPVTHKRLDELHPADVATSWSSWTPSSAPTCSSIWTTRRPPRPSPRWTTSTRPTSSKTSTTLAPPAFGRHGPGRRGRHRARPVIREGRDAAALMGVEDATEIRRLLGYKDGTAGGMMTTQFVAVKADNTVGETIEVLRELDDDHPTVHYVYVLNDYDEFVGVLSLRTLVLTETRGRARRDVRRRDLRDAGRDRGGRGGRHLQVRAARHARGGRARRAAGIVTDLILRKDTAADLCAKGCQRFQCRKHSVKGIGHSVITVTSGIGLYTTGILKKTADRKQLRCIQGAANSKTF